MSKIILIAFTYLILSACSGDSESQASADTQMPTAEVNNPTDAVSDSSTDIQMPVPADQNDSDDQVTESPNSDTQTQAPLAEIEPSDNPTDAGDESSVVENTNSQQPLQESDDDATDTQNPVPADQNDSGNPVTDTPTSDTQTTDIPAFTNLEANQPVELTQAFWLVEDFENKAIACSWFSFDGTSYSRFSTPIAIDHDTERFSASFQGSSAFTNSFWSVTNGVYEGFANFEFTPWLEILERNNAGNDTSAVRFWYFDTHYQECSSINPVDFFRPTGTGTPAAPQAGDDEDPGSDTEVSADVDAVWQFCDAQLITPPQGQAFGTFSPFTFSDTTRQCVRRCPDIAIELEGAPGWGFDAAVNAECIFDETDGTAFSTSVPVFDLNQKLEFEQRFAFPLYEDDGFWQCGIESRNSNTESFAAGGEELTFQLTNSFDSADRDDRNWFFDNQSERRSLQIEVDLEDGTPFIYNGFALIRHNSLVIYKTSLERLSCNRLNPVEDFSLPVTIRAFDQAPALTAQDLLGQTAQCQAIESLQDLVFNPDEEGFTNTFGPGNIPDEFEVAVEFSIVDPLGFFRYVLSSIFNVTYRFGQDFNDGELFDSSDLGDSPTATFFNTFRFRDFGTFVMAERMEVQASSGSRVEIFTYYVCDSL